MPIKPFKYQKEGILDLEDFLTVGGGALLADDMGLGKTLQVLWLLRRQKAGPMFPALVVCPASVKYMWEYAALEHIGIRAQVLEGREPPADGFIPDMMAKIVIINPDILANWAPYLLKSGFQTMVLDECHDYGNHKSKRTKAAFSLAKITPYRLALSGTPLMNCPGELWPTLYMLRKDKFSSLFSFGTDFCHMRKQFGDWQYKGAKNLPKLNTLLRRTVMVRRRKEDVLKDLPPKIRSVVPMDLTDRAQYDFATSDFIGWLRKHYRDKQGRVQRAARAAAVTRVGYLVRLAARLKVRSVVDWSNRFLQENPNEKLILFTVHRKMIEVLDRRVVAPNVIIDGRVTGRLRKNAVDKFRHDPGTRLLLGNIKAAGVGLDGLQEVCNTVGFTEMWWVPGAHVQAEDRIYRIGKKGAAWINYLVAGGTIEETLCRVIQTKQAVIHATLDGADFKGDMNIYDELIQSLEEST